MVDLFLAKKMQCLGMLWSVLVTVTLTETKRNIGTQSVQELFFCDSIRRTVYNNDLVKFFGCDIQQVSSYHL